MLEEDAADEDAAPVRGADEDVVDEDGAPVMVADEEAGVDEHGAPLSTAARLCLFFFPFPAFLIFFGRVVLALESPAQMSASPTQPRSTAMTACPGSSWRTKYAHPLMHKSLNPRCTKHGNNHN